MPEKTQKIKETKEDWIKRNYSRYTTYSKWPRKRPIALPNNKISFYSEDTTKKKKQKNKTMMKDIADRRSKEGKSFLTSN